jgi:predicted transposase/invertase (TIGR01784 family)
MTEKAIGGLDEDMVIGIKKGLKKGREKGIKAGMRKGMKQGIEKGIEKEKFEVAKKLLDLHLPINDIVNTTGLTEEQILAL